ncbi:MAG: glycosyltransferase family 39 protein [Anaerolineae bacterium]|nr:glycosyltransferase family 39 protein [Anaerolineae bacterium]
MTWAILLAVTLFGAMVRFYKLGQVPPGLYHDEAFNGLDAYRVLAGVRPIFFVANNGREPLFLYGIALSMAFLGRTPIAVRLVAAFLGTLLVPATFLMTRTLFNKWIGLWSAFLIAVLPWPVNLGRIGLRAIALPLVLALAVWVWWPAREGRTPQCRARRALGGALFGLSLYTYTAARFIIVIVLIYVLYQWLLDRKPLKAVFGPLVVPACAALLVAMPLLAYGVAHWDAFVLRPGQVSVLNTQVNGGDLWGTLAGNVLRAAGMFFVRGDFIPRHNVPLRPLFDPLLGLFFMAGVVWALVRARKDQAAGLASIWVAVMLLPTILAEDCPHFLRAVGVLPAAALFPAFGLEWGRTSLERRSRAWIGWLLVALVLLVSGVWSFADYFVRHGQNPELAYAFEADQVQEAVEINRFLGTGWQGEGIVEPTGALIPGRRVYLHPRMWEDRHTVNFLVASPGQISILRRDPLVDANEVLVLAWPHEDLSYVRQTWPRPALISAWLGPLERGDLDVEAKRLYVAFQATRLETIDSTVIARFEQNIELSGWEVEPVAPDQTRLTLRWQARQPIDTDYTVFVHVVRGGQTVAQDDGFPGQGYLPTTWWQPGDQILDAHVLATAINLDTDQVVVGWYEWRSMQHLSVLDEHSAPAGTSLVLNGH